MSTILSLTAIAALGALAVWVAGSLALRITGALLALAGLAGFTVQTDAFAAALTLAVGFSRGSRATGSTPTATTSTPARSPGGLSTACRPRLDPTRR